MNTRKSRTLYGKAKRLIPGGAVTESKKPPALFGGDDFPAYFREARGAVLTDIDGNRYIDYCMALGAVLLGYNHPEVNKAIAEQLRRGILASLCNEKVVRLAEELVRLVPCAEMVRLLKTGAEATAAAVRAARAFTGRDKVLTCGYHGWHDWCNTGRGVPRAVRGLSFPFEFGDTDSFRSVFDRHRKQLACVVMEPVIEREPPLNFLREIRRSCDKAGVVLVFDEIKTGFRVALGGAQERYGVVPDLTALGKGMANGMPLAALVGRRKIMKVLGEGAWVSSTYAGEVLSVAASLKVFEILQREPVLAHIERLGGRLLDGLREIAAEHPEMLEAGGIPQMNFIRFRKDCPRREEAERAFFEETLRGGVLLKRTAYNFVSYAHTARQIDRTLEVTATAADRLRRRCLR